ncbi:mitochondrial import receptor subunit TOM7 homolog isoform X1 [Heterodontus francisci]|uniref:mitochondrial import receptor subunit TOM7 homolog isoform X1 n=1 Tax=Heterodontus francisci TaxID=7792 RepID=UPI00355AD5E7
MVKMSKETKQRLQQVFRLGQFAIRWGFIPTILYLGFRRGGDPGMPEPNLLSMETRNAHSTHKCSLTMVLCGFNMTRNKSSLLWG